MDEAVGRFGDAVGDIYQNEDAEDVANGQFK